MPTMLFRTITLAQITSCITVERQTSREEHKGYSFVCITYPYRGETSPLLYCTFFRRRNAIV